MELSATLNTESMDKQKLNTLVHWLTYLHTFMHAEPSHYFAYYRTRVNSNWQLVPHAANTINAFSANPFHSKMYHHTYKSTRKTKNYGKVLNFQSENGINYTYYIVKLVSVLFCLQTVFECVVLNANATVFQ